MLTIRYYQPDEIADRQLGYAVIAAVYNNRWLFCRQKSKNTYELPAGHREKGESILAAAERELREETGAIRFTLTVLCAFHVATDDQPPAEDSEYGLFCLARVEELGALPAGLEMAEVICADQMPDNLSYPEVQPQLFALARDRLFADTGEKIN